MNIQRWYANDEMGADDTGTWVLFADHIAAVAEAREDAYQKGRDHGWALNAECCGSCPGECAQQVALRQMKEEGRI